MQLNTRVAGIRTPLVATRRSAAQSLPRQVLVRFQEDNQNGDSKRVLVGVSDKTDTKLSTEEIKEVANAKFGELSPRKAEIRADLGNAQPSLDSMQAFDGPAPETINGRLAMLACATGLLGEWYTGLGIREQIADHPITVLASFVIISAATYAPLNRGYTRKEGFEVGPFTARSENFNGRLAMIGFTGIIITEALTHVNTLQAWGLQAVGH